MAGDGCTGTGLKVGTAAAPGRPAPAIAKHSARQRAPTAVVARSGACVLLLHSHPHLHRGAEGAVDHGGDDHHRPHLRQYQEWSGGSRSNLVDTWTYKSCPLQPCGSPHTAPIGRTHVAGAQEVDSVDGGSDARPPGKGLGSQPCTDVDPAQYRAALHERWKRWGAGLLA